MLIVLVVLVAFRLTLPYFVTRYTNNVLSKLEGYHGSVEDVDISLLKGAYQIKNLKISAREGNNKMPFVNIPVTDLSIEWGAIMQGALVGEVVFHQPVLNFIANAANKGGENVDWTQPIKQLMPLKINRLTVDNGEVAFYDFSTKPEVNVFLHNVQLDATNLSNAKDNPEELPSRVYLQALSIGNGQLNAAMKINLLKKVPDMDMDLSFENVDMTALNDFFKAYAAVDIEKGNFNMYSELVVLNGEISGYVKPLFNELKVVDWKDDRKQPAAMVWESMVGFLAEVFENQKENQFATQVPLQGQIAEVNSPFLPTIWNVFSNAFIQAFEADTKGTVSIASAVPMADQEAAPETKSKKDLRKEKRKQKKEERRLKKERKAKEENEKADKKSEKDNS
jgi:hypothetical protein